MTSIGGLGGLGAIGGLGEAGGAAGIGGGGGGLGGAGGIGGSLNGSDGGLGGLGDMGVGGAGGVRPTTGASDAQSRTFSDTLGEAVLERPSAAHDTATDLATRFASGDTSVDPHDVAIASAKAGVEIQMATRTISQAVSAVRTLFQMQI